VQSLLSVIEIERSARKDCCENILKLSGLDSDAQNVDNMVQLTERPSFIRIAAIRGKQLMRLFAVTVVLKLML
jgi:hypothetical protein